MKRNLVVLIVFLGFAAQTVIANVETGLAAIKSKNYEVALQELKPLAERGDPKAQYLVGTLYEQGLGVAKNDVEAEIWYHLAADQRDGLAQTKLGLMYSQRRGLVLENPNIYARYVRQLFLAHIGDSKAQFDLGKLYQIGYGWPSKNNVVALALYELIIRKDIVFAPQVVDERQTLLDEMSSQEIKAASNLATLMAKPDNLLPAIEQYLDAVNGECICSCGEDDSEDANIAGCETIRNSSEFKQLLNAAEQGDTNAQVELGQRYSNGIGNRYTNEKEATKWFRKAAYKGNAMAQLHLGNEFGRRDIPPDDILTEYWYRRAANQGEPLAQKALADFYLETREMSIDSEPVMKWYRLAADGGNIPARLILADQFDAPNTPKKHVIAAYAINLTIQEVNPAAVSPFTMARLAKKLKKQELSDAKALALEMGKKGHFLEALDQYLQNPSSKAK